MWRSRDVAHDTPIAVLTCDMGKPDNIILIGMKSSGKTTAGRLLARRLRARFIDMDAEIEKWHAARRGERLPFREIFKKHGGDYFRATETAALRALVERPPAGRYVLSTGGGLPLSAENREILRGMGIIVFLDVREDVLLARIVAGGIPAFFPHKDDPRRSLTEIMAVRQPIYSGLATIHLKSGEETPEENVERLMGQLEKLHREN